MRGSRLIRILIFSALTLVLTVSFALTLSAAKSKDEIDAVIMDFSSEEAFAANALMLRHVDNAYDEATNSFANFEFTTVDGVGAMKLIYNDYGSWAKYRFMPQFNKANMVTNEHRYIRVTYRTDDIISNVLRLRNNGQGTFITLVPNTKISNNKFVISNAVDIYQPDTTNSSGSSMPGMLARFVSGSHCTFEFLNSRNDVNIYVKEIAFFKSEEDAYAYYGDEPINVDIDYTFMSFGNYGNASARQSADYGNNSENFVENTLDIFYAETTNFGNHFMAKVYFDKVAIGSNHYYYKILYQADLPDSEASCTMELRADAGGGTQTFTGITDTNGEFVFSDVAQLVENQHTRFASGNHCSLTFSSASPESVFRIKGIFFFATEEDAERFEYREGGYKVVHNGVDISKYKIVIDTDAPTHILEAAESIDWRIKFLTGTSLPIVDDSEPESEYEIIIGNTSRANSYDILSEHGLNYEDNYQYYLIATTDTKIYITAYLPPSLQTGAKTFCAAFLFDGLTEIPETMVIPTNFSYAEKSSRLRYFTAFTEAENVEDPEVFYEDFARDRGYFTEESYAQDFNIANGVMTTDAEDYALTYIHVYEKNAIVSADLMFENAGEAGDFGLMLRYNSADAWVKAGYDFNAGEWYIDSRDGQDFYYFRCDAKEGELTEGKVYRVELKADGDTATLSVDGKIMLSTNEITHFSPGRVGVYAEDISLTVDNVEFTMLSGQGTIWKDVVHTKVETTFYTEGGTVLEKDSETLAYMQHRGIYLESTDNGKTWTESSQWIPVSGYYNVIRLNDGGLLRITTKSSKVISQTSHDNGVTWVDGGEITDTQYLADVNYAAGAGNMNDKIFQASPTSEYYPDRIFYSQNYESRNSLEEYNYRTVFCQFYYSDDNGATWTKSDTDSWTIEGNENETRFGECKFIECADGTIRMYNSWNMHDCIVYSDSNDGGKTFGPLQFMNDFPCSTSSMQFVRDKYADNDSTYYMVWVNAFDHPASSGVRCGLTLAYTEDGKNWVNLGEIWRWESTMGDGPAISQVVDPFIQVTKDYIICGSGLSEGLETVSENGVEYHNSQRQHIYSIPKAAFKAEENLSLTYSADDYSVLANGTQLVVIEAYGNSVTYSYDGTEFYYSPKYNAHVAILDASLTKADIYANIEITDTPAEEITYNGDINGDKRVTAGDAALVSSILHTPDNAAYTAKMRLEADVYGAHVTNEDGKFSFVTALDCCYLLHKSVGLK